MEYIQIEARIRKSLLPRFLLIVSISLFIWSFSLEWPIYQEKGVWVNNGWAFSKDRLVMYKDKYSSFISYFLKEELFSGMPSATGAKKLFCFGFISMICSCIMGWRMNHSALTVTNFRIVGKTSFGKTVDIPLQHIIEVAPKTFNRLTIATSAGKRSFWGIQNRDEVYNSLTYTIQNNQQHHISLQ